VSVKKRIPQLFFISTLTFWAISILLVYLPVSPWSGPVFPKTVDASMMNIFLVATALSFTASLMMGFRGFFNKPNLKANGKIFLKPKIVAISSWISSWEKWQSVVEHRKAVSSL